MHSSSCSSEGGGGVGWGGVGLHLSLASPLDILLHLMLRHLIFSATPLDLLVHLMLRHWIFRRGGGVGWGGVGWGWCYTCLLLRHLIFSCTWCYATGSLEGGVGLGGVGWGWYYTCLLLRHLIFSCTWCYATWSSLALDATPLDLLCYATWIKSCFCLINLLFWMMKLFNRLQGKTKKYVFEMFFFWEVEDQNACFASAKQRFSVLSDAPAIENELSF